ncbi:MAG: SDR family NAD(P)-dependent oxidoreductase, partial [Chitinophagales bacterium]|nr:SDR family NAD(P)-dependent oxidoreductase [Chitinophagales bacterium]
MENKFALVTGGSRGIGRACCIKLAEMGYHVLVNYKGNKEAADETVRLLQIHGVAGEALQFDVSDKEEVKTVLSAWQEVNKEAVLEVLVNNAGVRHDTLMMSMTEDQWDGVMNTSLNGMYHVTKQVLNNMLMNRYGRIINMVSVSGLKGQPGQVNYSAAKAGMIGATKALGQEIAKRNVTV